MRLVKVYQIREDGALDVVIPKKPWDESKIEKGTYLVAKTDRTKRLIYKPLKQ